MRVVNAYKLFNCSEKIREVFKAIQHQLPNYYSGKMPVEVTVTSGGRDDKYTKDTDGGRYCPSWHDEKHGYNAIDFYFKGVDVFAVISYIYEILKENCSKATELEVVRGGGKQHIHIACGNEGYLQTFTGKYGRR